MAGRILQPSFPLHQPKRRTAAKTLKHLLAALAIAGVMHLANQALEDPIYAQESPLTSDTATPIRARDLESQEAGRRQGLNERIGGAARSLWVEHSVPGDIKRTLRAPECFEPSTGP